MKTIYIINGPNLNLLGKRENDIYGDVPFEVFFGELKNESLEKCHLHYFQSNHEGFLLDKMQEIGFRCDGIIINPGAYTHTSIALADCVRAISCPVVEVHISDIYSREKYRHISYIKEHSARSVIGKGLNGYREGLDYLLGL